MHHHHRSAAEAARCSLPLRPEAENAVTPRRLAAPSRGLSLQAPRQPTEALTRRRLPRHSLARIRPNVDLRWPTALARLPCSTRHTTLHSTALSSRCLTGFPFFFPHAGLIHTPSPSFHLRQTAPRSHGATSHLGLHSEDRLHRRLRLRQIQRTSLARACSHSTSLTLCQQGRN